MSEEIMKWIPWAILFVLFTSLLVLIHKKFKKHNVMEEIANKYRENMDEKMMAEAAFVTNPSALLISEIKNLMKETYTGKCMSGIPYSV